MIVVIGAGVVAGLLHVLSGPDHLAAVTPLAADSRRRPWQSGLLWGVGHTSGVALIGVLAVLLRDVLPVDLVSSWSERAVGVALVLVGVWGVRRALVARVHVHVHEHVHGAARHAHVHVHGREPRGEAGHASGSAHAHTHTHASFAFGILHGLAGSSHVLGILPALALPTRTASFTYLAAYGAGSIAGMTAFSSAVGWVAGRARLGGASLYRGLLGTCSAAAIVVGVAWLAL